MIGAFVEPVFKGLKCSKKLLLLLLVLMQSSAKGTKSSFNS